MANVEILIVDDEAHLCKALGIMLERGGYKVMLACNGEEALELARQHIFDLVLRFQRR